VPIIGGGAVSVDLTMSWSAVVKAAKSASTDATVGMNLLSSTVPSRYMYYNTKSPEFGAFSKEFTRIYQVSTIKCDRALQKKNASGAGSVLLRVILCP
jgi:hypothetical protein